MTLLHRELETTSSVKHLTRVRAFLREALQDVSPPLLDDGGTNEIELALVEGFTNTVQHAYDGRTGEPIRIEVEIFEDRVAIQLFHWGQEMDVDHRIEPSFDGSRDHGFGLYIMDQCADEVIRTTAEGQPTCISLIKYRSRVGPA